MKVCLAQYDIIWEDKKANMSVCEGWFMSAQESGAELLVFPELSLTGFTTDVSLAESADGEAVRFFSQCAKRYGVPCVFGYAERSGEVCFNRLAFADKDGRVAVRYSKLHPFSFGGEVYSGGGELCWFSHGGMEIGLTICYDLRFPEIYQQLSKRCACIIVAANWGGERRLHWLTLLQARAIENQCFIIGVNRTGTGGGVSYTGDSAVFAPNGGLICSADNRERLLCADINPKSVWELRSSFPLKNDRRPEIYRNFYE